MKKFLISCFLFGLILFLIDRAFILFRYHETNIFRAMAKAKMEKIKSAGSKFHEFSTIIIGSSHAQTGISPEIYNSVTGENAINLAYGGGANLGAQFSIINQILNEDPQKIKIKTILYGLDVFALNRKPAEDHEFKNIVFKNVESPALSNKIFKPFISLYARFIPRYLKEASRGNIIPPYLRKDTTFDLSMFHKFEGYKITDLGWIKCYGLLNPNFVRYDKVNFEPDPEALIKLKKIASLCHKHNIRLVIFQIPENISCFYHRKKYDDYHAFMKNFSREENIDFMDFNNLKSFPLNDNSLFFDTDHLNAKGAARFSNLLGNSILANQKASSQKN